MAAHWDGRTNRQDVMQTEWKLRRLKGGGKCDLLPGTLQTSMFWDCDILSSVWDGLPAANYLLQHRKFHSYLASAQDLQASRYRIPHESYGTVRHQ